ncbi:uncharacterized protein FA14DRAFT_169982 [Meira miltonrushii]|uniref:Uncharacterized protein n=1 Tax=Meira miltonrushii TaxID=1280837 RepID=A0A316VIL2_9BASI|nr:uncharacterized protein FA14DRAFT_169982 [Meira miltonrushii]PWN37094.1 hypothetical protein FA14DRAFT_169982 [Meira miltonrushii]
MTADGDKTRDDNPNILSSAFFEPSIIKTFLRITLADERFPALVIHYLMQADEGKSDQKEVTERLDAIRSAANGISSSPFYLKDEHKTALKEAIQALCTFLALPDSNNMEAHQQRVMLGFCRLLSNQPIEGIFEFDIVRKALYSKMNKRAKEGKDAKDTSEEQQLYQKTLWGAELAAGMMGKESEAERYRKWRHNAQLE